MKFIKTFNQWIANSGLKKTNFMLVLQDSHINHKHKDAFKYILVILGPNILESWFRLWRNFMLWTSVCKSNLTIFSHYSEYTKFDYFVTIFLLTPFFFAKWLYWNHNKVLPSFWNAIYYRRDVEALVWWLKCIVRTNIWTKREVNFRKCWLFSRKVGQRCCFS